MRYTIGYSSLSVIIILILLILIRFLCYPRFEFLIDLKKASISANNESHVFKKLATFKKNRFCLYDKNFNIINYQTQERYKSVYIEFSSFGNPPILHKLIDSRNIDLLLLD